ncbi:hypothetical protein L21SP5_00941 [Salinivirga cyanobacteriivorans]|uniref:Sulfotransferase domain protein n=1 Tax=Salinivirga cyanobacteriivorans TaxID=1307839 RepID=A0A0S2HX03_9BACT|nr:sulfotransferase [Salinivirga cyanobacteriivorans]ALO14608.1 hypothetical protein L21SP5_00941 [Salinivirga cyanobacteriivorans]
MIIYYPVLVVSFFIIGLLLRVNRFVFHRLAENSVGLVDGLISATEEDEKIKEVQQKTNGLVAALLKMFLVIIIAFAAGSIPIIIYALATGTSYAELDFFSFYAILFLSLGATIPFIIPLGKKKESSYSELSQLLHRMALDNYNISNRLFKRERKKIRKKGFNKKPDFVIVSGLARAGTTSLMNDLSEVDGFVSLNYANMPFLMAPNTWRKFYKPKTKKLKERSHKDGIMIGYNSNEALEEYFFKVKADDAFIKPDHLTEYVITEETYNDYLDYQNIIKLDDKKTYLAKNNNFILRYKSMREFNDEFIMVLMFRDPLTHAASLMEKHLEYQKLQKEDPFVLEYMNWLGHHEFGLNQKPFVFSEHAYHNQYDKTSLNYWLKNWIYYYQYILKTDHPNTLLINYDDYCKNPGSIVETVLQKTTISADIPDYKAFNNSRKTNREYDKSLYEEAQQVYSKLIDKVSNIK